MNSIFIKSVEKKDINIFIGLSFFFIFLSYILTKGFIENEEISDFVFLSSSLLLVELSYLVISNKNINYKNISINDYLVFLIFFILLFCIWNFEIIDNYTNTFLFFTTHLLLIFPTIYLIKLNNSLTLNKRINKDFLLQISILSILLSGFFFQINYSKLNLFFFIIFLSISILLVNYLLYKLPSWINFILSLFIISCLAKVFLLSSAKDAFHYSWYLGPINSVTENYKLLDNVASQYGYLNILFISKLSELIDLSSTDLFIGIIIFLFFIFYFLFFFKIIKIINLPKATISFFLCFLIFGNIGYSNLAGAMFIPSSSVFRFLPSLITIILFSQILKEKNKNISLLLFFFSFLISLFWSIESAIFVIFSIGSFFIVKLFFFLISKKKFNLKIISFLKSFYIEIILGIFVFGIILFFVNYDNFYLFYEHALNSQASLSKEIINNKITLIYLYLLVLCYFILRDSLNFKNNFYYNALWFGLFVAYSSYFLVRSVDSNVLNILPFILFILCCMKVNSKHLKELRVNTIITIIFFTLISSIISTIHSQERFFKNLFSSNFFNKPEFLRNDYLPDIKILNIIKNYPNTPLTLVSGKTIHSKNLNLPKFGYGLPILPLEHFNILRLSTKQNLIDEYFINNKKHLLLCIKNCSFYSFDTDTNIRNKIFIGNKIKFKKIIEVETINSKEILYILSKK